MPKKDATDKGVSSEKEDTEINEETEEKVIGTGHASAIDNIADQVNKDHFEEIGEELPKEEEKTDETDERAETEKTETEQEEEETPKEETEGSEEELESEPEKVKVKVDGVEQEVTQDELVRGYQKNAAADSRLEEATQLLKDAKEVKKDKTQLSEKTDADEDITDAEKPDFNEIKKGLVNAIQYGEDDDVDQAFDKFIGALSPGQAPTINKDEIISEVKEGLKAENIVTKFGKSPEDGGYKDLLEDPRSAGLVNAEIDKMLSDGEPNDWSTYQKAGNEIRKYLGRDNPTPDNKLKTAVEKAEDEAMEKKRDKKRKIDSIDSVSASQQNESEDEKSESPKDTIKAMAQSRPGQQIY